MTQKSFITIAGNNYITQILHREHLYYIKIHTSSSFYILVFFLPIYRIYGIFDISYYRSSLFLSPFRVMECPIFLQISSQVILGYLPAVIPLSPSLVMKQILHEA